MHAIRLHTFGPAENLAYEETDDPTPGPGQLRIAFSHHSSAFISW
jgi:NADPH2:quinone reductase